MAVESGLEAAEFDLAVTPLRELNAALHAIPAPGPVTAQRLPFDAFARRGRARASVRFGPLL